MNLILVLFFIWKLVSSLAYITKKQKLTQFLKIPYLKTLFHQVNLIFANKILLLLYLTFHHKERFYLIKILAKVYLENLHSSFEGWFTLFTLPLTFFWRVNEFLKIRFALQTGQTHTPYLNVKSKTTESYSSLT